MQPQKFCALALILLLSHAVFASDGTSPYSLYQKRLDNVKTMEDIETNGFTVFEDRVFQERFQHLGDTTIIPALDLSYGRLVLFLTGEDGSISFKTDQLECNYQNRGELKQPNFGLSAIAFRDLNHNGLRDIILVTVCKKESGSYAGRAYLVGDVLFQDKDGFYRDWRISDRLNRFGMNIDIEMITAFVRDGISSEFLYTAKTLDQLLENGFQVMEGQDRTVDFEKFGEVRIVPGTYFMAGHYILMLYAIDPDGMIVWSFQPMGSYSNFNRMKGISFQDIDGDGLKDVSLLIRYDILSETGETLTLSDYSIYYQRAGYFYEDTEFKRTYTCTERDNLSDIMERAQEFWRAEERDA